MARRDHPATFSRRIAAATADRAEAMAASRRHDQRGLNDLANVGNNITRVILTSIFYPGIN
jgi:hypothetical protein